MEDYNMSLMRSLRELETLFMCLGLQEIAVT